jgi:hypothetical protein
MKSMNRIRLLVTLVLVVVATAAVAGSARASRVLASGSTGTTLSSMSGAKPPARPTDGEPDGGQTIKEPIILQHSASPLGGFGGADVGRGFTTDWTLWIWAAWITRLAR